jgi:hypothetical protein
MKTRIAFVLALFAAAACGDDTKGNNPDSGVDPNPDGNVDPDAPVTEANFTTYVIDLVVNKTANDTAPRPYSEFEALPDPDGDANNTAAYATLFQ